MKLHATVPLSYFYAWDKIPFEMFPNMMREFQDNGAKHLVITDFMLENMIRDPQYLLSLRKHMFDTKMEFFECHGLWSRGNDMVCIDKCRRPGLIADHKLAMSYAAELGCKTYVMHIGAYESVFFSTPNEELRPNGIEVLEQLLPHAEKLGIIIAVENSYEISNTPDEALYYVEHFKHPNLGCCMDVGHANIMAPGEGKTNDRYHADLLEAWHGKVVQYENAFEKMAPYIVTMHLHDNDGFGDHHWLPGYGTINWEELASKIATLPRLQTLQCEVRMGAGVPWTIRKVCETMQKIFPECQ